MTMTQTPPAVSDRPGLHDLAMAARAAKAGQWCEQLDRVRSFQASLSERTPSQGGFLVPEYLRTDLALASLESAIIRPLATVLPMRSLRLGVPVVDDTTHASSALLGGITWNWTEEGATLTTTGPAYGRIILDAKKLAVYLGLVPDEFVADADAFGAFLARAVPAGLAWSEDQAFIAGSGVGQPQGILNAPCAISVTRAASGKVGMTDILSMLTRILPQSMNHAIWLCSPDVLQQILQAFLQAPVAALVNVTLAATTVASSNPNPYPVQVTVSGGTVTAIAINGVTTNATSGTFTLGVGATISVTYSVAPTTFTTAAMSTATGGVVPPPNWLTGSDKGWTLLGAPLYATEHVPALGTKGDLILVDPRFYLIGDRRQMTVEASQVGAGFVKDETEFRFISRLDGRIWLQSAVTPQNSSQTVSAVVVLN